MREPAIVELIRNIKRYGMEYFNRYYSWYRGKVTNNLDPEARGRIKATCPSITGKSDQELNAWILPSGNYSGNDVGDFMPPEVGSMVFIVFENGDIRYPIYFGGFWTKATGNNVLPTEMKDASPYPTVKGFKTKYGHKILFFDQDTYEEDGDGNVVEVSEPTVKNPRIEIETKYGHKIILTDEYEDESNGSQKISVTTPYGHVIEFDDKTDQQKISLTTGSGHTMVLDDTKDAHQAKIETVKGHKILLDDENEKVEIEDGVNSNTQLMNSDGYKITDANGNVFEMASDGVKVNGHYLATHDFLDWLIQQAANLGMGNMGAPVPVFPSALTALQTGVNTPDSFKTDK